MFSAPSHFQDDSYEVLSIERMTKPAFRLGCEVFDNLTVTRDGKKYTISLSMQHTMCGDVKKFAKGDRIMIKKSEVRDGETVSRELVRTAK